jgi:hypothetical protein
LSQTTTDFFMAKLHSRGSNSYLIGSINNLVKSFAQFEVLPTEGQAATWQYFVHNLEKDIFIQLD